MNWKKALKKMGVSIKKVRNKDEYIIEYNGIIIHAKEQLMLNGERLYIEESNSVSYYNESGDRGYIGLIYNSLADELRKNNNIELLNKLYSNLKTLY